MDNSEQSLSASNVTQSISTASEFWQLTDSARLEAEYAASNYVTYLERAPISELIHIFHEYRFFIKYFISDLGILQYKAPFGKFKCMIAQIAVDELGEEPEQCHLNLWDNFLVSLGDKREYLDNSEYPENIELLKNLSSWMLERSFMFGVGLRGMGAECLCQIYLSAAYKRLRLNPAIIEKESEIDWLFWDIHTGEEDKVHDRMVRNAIDEILHKDPTQLTGLVDGYQLAKQNWDSFWGNLHQRFAE